MSTPKSIQRRKLIQGFALAGVGLTGLNISTEAHAEHHSEKRQLGYIDTVFGKVAYQQDGAGPNLLLIHQSGHNAKEYDDVVPFLAKRFRVLVIDLPGHGRSDTPPRELEMQDFTDVIVQLLNHLNIARTHVVGTHGGGSLAVDLGTRYASMVDKLIFVGLGRGKDFDIEKIKNTPLTRDLPVDDEGEFLAKTWAVYRKLSAKGVSPDTTLKSFAVSIHQRQRPYDMHHAAYRWDYYKVIHTLDKPSLFLKPEYDIYSGDTEGLSKRVKNSVYKTVPGGGVFVFYEQPERIANVIADFCLA
jgi:pimeloyl-ACP methyl ester carboxylesterase